MDQNMNWAHLLSNHLPAYPVQSHTEPMDSDVYSHQAGFSTHELPQLPDTLPAFPFPAQGLPVGVTEFSQNAMHIDMFGNPQYTPEELLASVNFPQPVMYPNLWVDRSNLIGVRPEWAQKSGITARCCPKGIVAPPLPPPTAMDGLFLNTLPAAAACFPTLQLPVNDGGNYLPVMDPKPWAHFEDLTIRSPSGVNFDEEISSPFVACVPTRQLPVSSVCGSSQGMLHNEGYNSGHCGYTSPHFSSPLMEVVQGATTSSSRQTRRETGNSSRRPYAYWSIEDVTQLIIAVCQHGVKVKSWRKIVDQSPYFKDKGRDKDHLMEKWRHMMTANLSKCDPQMIELYIWARDVDAKLK